ncbi:hypothetical protein, variant [Capsaspora owczarzaki ATCC 30864]|uniref:Uncharacterized protein n=1 Tax=Capsaspora owczarzaki (strain ATCC 30864) TaxID=595528 RepID=A0A0D2UBA7_CAPO3|nr:hypothetical protein, variant [Capsaspora owczarzaki ATCC 30864]
MTCLCDCRALTLAQLLETQTAASKVRKAPMPLPSNEAGPAAAAVQEDLYQNSTSIRQQIQELSKPKQDVEWTEVSSDGGKSYFFNARTRRSTWSKPESLNGSSTSNSASASASHSAGANDEYHEVEPSMVAAAVVPTHAPAVAAPAGAASGTGTIKRAGPPVPLGKPPRNSFGPSDSAPASPSSPGTIGVSAGAAAAGFAASSRPGTVAAVSKPSRPSVASIYEQDSAMTDYEEELYQNLTSVRASVAPAVRNGLLGALGNKASPASGSGANKGSGASGASGSGLGSGGTMRRPSEPAPAIPSSASAFPNPLARLPSTEEENMSPAARAKAREARLGMASANMPVDGGDLYMNQAAVKGEMAALAAAPAAAAAVATTVAGADSYTTLVRPDRVRHAHINQINVVIDADHSLLMAVKKTEPIRDFCRLIESQFALTFPFDPNFHITALKDQEDNPISLSDTVGSLPVNATIFVEKSTEADIADQDTASQLQEGAGKRKLRVRTMAGDVKTILVDESAPCKQVLPLIASKMGMINYQEFGLSIYVVEKVDKNDPRRRLYNSFGGVGKISKKVSKTSMFSSADEEAAITVQDEDSLTVEHWLDMNESLAGQGIKMNDVVFLKRRFYFFDDSVYSTDPAALKLCYFQAKAGVLSGENPCNLAQAVTFAALQCQVTFGNFDKALVTFNDKTLGDVLPADHIKSKRVDKAVMEEYIKLKGIAATNAMFLYMQLYNGLETYGISKFWGFEASPKKKRLEPSFVGVTSSDIMRIDFKTGQIDCKWPLRFVHHYSTTVDFFKLYFGENAEQVICISTMEAQEISGLLEGYTTFILARQANSAAS